MRLEDIGTAIGEVAGVNNVHDLHVWSIGSNIHALSCHISIADIPPSASENILREVRQMVAGRFSIHHTTIQFEHAICEIANGCVIPGKRRPRTCALTSAPTLIFGELLARTNRPGNRCSCGSCNLSAPPSNPGAGAGCDSPAGGRCASVRRTTGHDS